MEGRGTLDSRLFFGLSSLPSSSAVKISYFNVWLVSSSLCATSIGGCGSTESPPENPPESLPACSDVDWLGRLDHAQLTGEPTFSATEIPPGEPLRIAVPVDVNTRSVRVSIASIDLPGVGTGAQAETGGGAAVEIPVKDTNLPAGVYVANKISLDGERFAQSAGYLSDRDVDAAYQISVFGTGESFYRCETDLNAPTFVILGNGSEDP
jgi:hypothetical protein